MRGRKWRMGGNAKNFNNRAMRLPLLAFRRFRVRLALRKFASYAFLHSRVGSERSLGSIFAGLPPLYSRPRAGMRTRGGFPIHNGKVFCSRLRELSLCGFVPEIRKIRSLHEHERVALYISTRAPVCPRTLGAIFTGLPPLYSSPRASKR